MRRAIATRFDLAQGSRQATCTKKNITVYSKQQKLTLAHGGGRVVSASGSETSVSSSTPASAIIYDAYTSIIKKKKLTLSSSLECTPRVHSKIKVSAAQFRIAYCPTLKGFDIHKKNITLHSKN